jgi:hydrogenase maturation factor
VPVQPGVDATCAVFDIDPWTALSVGTLVLSVDPAGVDTVLDALDADAVPAADVGAVVDGSGLSVDGEAVAPPERDPFWAAIEADEGR